MPNLDDALSVIDQFETAHVMVVGDIMLDSFVYGEVERVSPEAPIPVLRTREERLMPGGAGNVIANLSGLGVHAHLISIVGDDVAAQTLADVLTKDAGKKVSTDLIVDADRPTSIKTRYLAGHQQLLRVDNEVMTDINADIEALILNAIKEKSSHYKTIILSDYGKGMLTNSLVAKIVEYAKQAGLKILVDPKGKDYSKYKGADVVTPNKKELSEATSHMATGTDADIEAATVELLTRSGIASVVATRSADGMTICAPNSDNQYQHTHLPTIAREVFDVSGAGDTVIATVAAGLAAGADLTMAAAISNAAGGLVVEKVGTAAIRVNELRGFLLEDGHQLFNISTSNDQQGAGAKLAGDQNSESYTRAAMLGAAPIMNWQDAADQVARWKARGLKVGFTNGAFDILHQGHVTYLAKSRALCDRLVVGLNCDASIKRYKSEDRPVNNEEARANVLSCLQSVDMVVIFGERLEEEDTPLMLMQALRPSVITKGADYTIDQVVGADFVQSYGGSVELIDLEEGFSTTNTIKKLSDAA